MLSQTEVFNQNKYCFINSDIVAYDVCASDPNYYDNDLWKYIGKGVIWSINGILQHDNAIRHFYTLKW